MSAFCSSLVTCPNVTGCQSGKPSIYAPFVSSPIPKVAEPTVYELQPIDRCPVDFLLRARSRPLSKIHALLFVEIYFVFSHPPVS